jgi:SAM-dependent methyltransferase
VDLRQLQHHWNRFGKDDPMWAVLTSPGKRFGRWDRDEFLESGVAEIKSVLELVDQVAQKEQMPLLRGPSLDFGCGVGRLTQALGDHFERCDGVDIAASMIETAEKWNRHGDRCRYHLNTRDDLAIFDSDSFDFVYSSQVLQHMEPRYSRRYIEEFLRVLRPGGYLLFEVVTEPVVGANTPLPDDAFTARISFPAGVPRVTAGRMFILPVRVENASAQTWPAAGVDGWFLVTVGNHWAKRDGRPILFDDGRANLPHDLRPGDCVTVELQPTGPPRAGTYRIEVDLVQEGVAWFADRGGSKAEAEIVVVSSNARWRSSLQRMMTRAGGSRGAKREPGPSGEPVMEMHGMPESEVADIVTGAGGRVLDVIDWDQLSGQVSIDWHRRGFIVTKPAAAARR